MRILQAKLVVGLSSLLFCGVGAQADLIYLDATDDVGGNTTLSDGSVLVANDGTGAATWRQRDNAEFGANGTVFEGVDPSPEIRTTITGLEAGQPYQVYVHYWDPQSTAEDWNISAGFEPGSLTLFSREGDSELAGSTAGVLASSLTYATAPNVFGPFSGREMIAGSIGTAFADAGGNLDVYIDDIGSGDVNQRTWYDGLSYELIPEPSTLSLVGIFGFILAVRRRFKG